MERPYAWPGLPSTGKEAGLDRLDGAGAAAGPHPATYLPLRPLPCDPQPARVREERSDARMQVTQVDAIVIGAGQAGVPLATRLAGRGKTVVLAERARVGGTCVNYGCTPTKTMVASARAAHVARAAGRLGVHAGEVRVDFAAVVARKDAVVRQWREGLDRKLAAAGEKLRLARGHARFVGERTVEVAGERYRADLIVLDVGARPAVPAIEGLSGVPWLDNHRLMELRQLPSHLVVLGGGYIGCEFAQLFRRLGAQVTVVGRGPHLLEREDDDVAQAVEEVFRKEGITLVLGAEVSRVRQAAGEGVTVALAGGREVAGSHLLVATGRRPNSDDLGCEAGGVRLGPRGHVEVDDHHRTSAPGVYAVGDVTEGPAFTHVSWDDHRQLLDHLEGRPSRGRSQRVVPHCVFTDPQVAGVGLDEREARRKGVAYELARLPFGSIARAIEVDETAGVVKVLVDPSSERILGASVVGAEAGELIHVLAALMQAGAPARALVEVEVAHPTLCEGLQSALMSLPRFAAELRERRPAAERGEGGGAKADRRRSPPSSLGGRLHVNDRPCRPRTCRSSSSSSTTTRTSTRARRATRCSPTGGTSRRAGGCSGPWPAPCRRRSSASPSPRPSAPG